LRRVIDRSLMGIGKYFSDDLLSPNNCLLQTVLLCSGLSLRYCVDITECLIFLSPELPLFLSPV
ncbi:MAG: hypothetical protein P8X42_19520, partial [Calditrichaceae bacterium]